MKKSLYKGLSCGFLVMAMSSCMSDSINENLSQPGADQMTADGYILLSAMSNICSTVTPSDVNCTQFVDCLLGGDLGGYFADGANFTTSFVRNNAPNNWSRVFMNDEKIIPTLFTNFGMIETICEQTGVVAPLAAAKIIKVAAMDRVTDCYGPIPYSQIGVDGIIQTPYDSQEEIYNKFFEELAEARELIQNNPSATMSPNVDLVYYGDMSKWLRFANSLQLRLALRISYANPALARQMAEAAVDPSNGGVIESNDQNATWKNYTITTNPMRTAILYNVQDSRPSAEIACYMTGYNDPRLPYYLVESAYITDGVWDKSPAGVSLQYVGIRRGWENFSTLWSVDFSGINLPANTPALWQNASEVCFLCAEASAVFGWNMGGNAEDFYNKGIELSFDNYGLSSNATDYIADNTSVPAQYYDPTGENPWNGVIPAVTIKWDNALTVEEKQQKIITQKWIANWTLGNEAWADYRRTGYPFLIPVEYNGAPGVVDINVGPQRMPYPSEEYTNNLENVQYAVTNYLGGPDNLGTRLWWACKPGM